MERLEGYRYLYSLDETGDGRFEVVLTREEPTLRMLALKAVSKIESHDRSSAVNSFTLGGRSMWLDKETRVGLVNSIGMEQAAGKETTVLWYDGQRYVIPIPLALQMLSCLELYALECYNVTQEHISAVLALETREEVEGYDYTSGYPDKLVFNL